MQKIQNDHPDRFSLKARVEGGNTPRLTHWGVNDEYSILTDVLLGPAKQSQTPVDQFAVAEIFARISLQYRKSAKATSGTGRCL